MTAPRAPRQAVIDAVATLRTAVGTGGTTAPTPGGLAVDTHTQAGPDRRDRRLLVDVLLAVGGCVLDLVAFSTLVAGTLPGWLIGYAVVGFAALLWRRRFPRTVFAILWLHTLYASTFTDTYGPVVGIAIAVFTVAELCSARTALGALVLTLIPIGVIAAAESAGVAPALAVSAAVASFTILSMVDVGAWALGRWSRAHRAELALAQEQRRAEAARAVAAERVAIARDLHDVVSHSVGVMTLQAAGARTVLAAGKAERATQALTDIEDAGGRAMVELRRMLDILRAPGAEEPGDRRAHPTLGDLEALVDEVRASGVPARMAVVGQPRELRASSELAIYRVVQEALTNVLKHAGPGTPTVVELQWSDAGLTVQVSNTAPTGRGSGSGSGYGLIGLRERMESVGGTLTTAAEPDGGFRVTATVPRES
ncbi:sensor histidine kinase [Pseudonocardia sp. CA-107938]|uniref:sensor histidine kinase n=1 Tax=Pseudonocardia sp. CA-107938 TaxID=3240021 RepID=UPI003D8C4EEF